MRRLLCLLLFVLPLRVHAAFTLREILSAPFPSDLTAAPHGNAIAWVTDAEGVRNIWIARAPAFAPVRITAFTADDGQDVSELAWVPDGSAILFTRGSNANGRGEFPNPLHKPEGVNQEIWIAPVSGNARRVFDGHSAAISPDGKTAAWLRGGQIWTAALPALDQFTQLTRARGTANGLLWSPDSSRLAFVSDRSDHALIGVYNFGNRSVSFPDPAADLDRSPVWSPDSSSIAFIRVPGSRYANEWGPRRTGLPWSIRVADVAGARGKEIWRARSGMGSVFWPISSASQMIWTSDRIVFPWEGDGWLHLYSVPVAGGTAASLTPGQFEVEDAALSGDRIVYSSNQNDLDRRHIWAVSPSGGAPAPLTQGTGVEARPVAVEGDSIALITSTAAEPAHVAILEKQVVRSIAELPASFPANQIVAPEPVELTATDGVHLHAQIFRPQGAGKHPAVVFFHGGARRQMVLGWQYNLSYYAQTYAFNQYLVSRGYVVLSVNYRAGTGYGERFREALHYGATGASEFADVLAAGNYLKARADVDPARIGIWGGSYGGYLTAMGLAKASNIFAAGVDLEGVHDWWAEISNYVPDYEPARRQAFATTAFQSSPMAWMNTWKSPVLLIQGDDDRNVLFNQMVLMAEQLRIHSVEVEELVFPDEIHEFLLHSHWLQAYEAAANFLDRHLRSIQPQMGR